MADNVRPRDLPSVPGGAVNPLSALVVDGGAQVERATPLQLVDAAIPLATQDNAELGVGNDTRMSPLRTRQAILTRGRQIGRINVTDGPFGADNTGSLPASDGINAALAFAASVGGGEVFMPAGVYLIDKTIDIKYPNVRLVSASRLKWSDTTTIQSGVRFLASSTMTGTMVKVRTPFAAERGISVGQAGKYTGAAFVGVALFGGGYAGRAIEVNSVSLVDINAYATGCIGSEQFLVTAGRTGTDLGEACDVQFSRIELFGRAFDTPAEWNTTICKLTGSSTANVSLNRGPIYGISVTGQHKNGSLFVGQNCDNNDIACIGYRIAGAGRLILAAAPTASGAEANPFGCTDNTFTLASGQGDIFAEGTDVAGATGPIYNRLFRDATNSAAVPVSGPNSNWEVHSSNNVTTGAAFKQIAIADTETAALNERKMTGNASLRVLNASNNHIVLSDGVNVFGMNIEASTGDFRIIHYAGGGAVSIDPGTPFKIYGKTVVTGAADSGGSGFRVLRVAN